MDTYEYSVVIIDLDAGEGETAHFSTAPDSFIRESTTYDPAPEITFDPAPLSGDFTKSDYKISNISNTIGIVNGLSVNLPYSKISATIREVFYDMDGVEISEEYLFRGYVYQCESRIGQARVDLILKDNKYYTDTTAGTPCTEACSNTFGDVFCQKPVYSEIQMVDTVSRNTLTINGPLSTTTDFLFNKGYIALGAQRIDIRYHETGNSFEMDRPVPVSWVGQNVEVFAGCDRSLGTCRNIHDNEEFFRGLGIAMVDYNPLYETT